MQNGRSPHFVDFLEKSIMVFEADASDFLWNVTSNASHVNGPIATTICVHELHPREQICIFKSVSRKFDWGWREFRDERLQGSSSNRKTIS